MGTIDDAIRASREREEKATHPMMVCGECSKWRDALAETISTLEKHGHYEVIERIERILEGK